MENKDSLILSIGGISLLLESDDHPIFSEIKDMYSNFIVKSSNYSIKIELTFSNDCNKFNNNLDHPEVKLERDKDLISIVWNSFYGNFNLYDFKGELIFNHPSSLNNYLRIIYSFILLDERGFLVHAASLIKNNVGYLFPGKSGTGKTTITRLSIDSILLSDEISLVKMIKGEYNIFGTPFWGELAIAGKNTHTPLNHIFLPKKDIKNYILPSKPINTLEWIVPNVLFFSDDEELKLKLFNICFDFVNSIPANELHFQADPSFWSVINVK